MKPRKDLFDKVLLLLCSLAVSLSLAGCGNEPAALTATADAAEEPPSPPPFRPEHEGNGFGVSEPVGFEAPERAGFVAWPTLAKVKLIEQQGSLVLRFDQSVRALDSKSVKLLGFVLPLTVGETQNHFILTATTPTCPFCLPGGPEQVVEIQATQSIKFGNEPIALMGRFQVLEDDPTGLFYRLTDARIIK
ncbi:DUF3299 domain-containing protein [Chitinimonas naiadis]